MQSCKKSHRHIWLLSGTGDGPPLAQALINQGWSVTVSVVSPKGSQPYIELPLENLWTGQLNGLEGIRSALKKAMEDQKGFDWVVDATHPFARVISSNLIDVCKALRQPLIRYERPFVKRSVAQSINDFKDLSTMSLKGERFLMAIGSRHLSSAAGFAREAGAMVFARVLPTTESLRQALAAKIAANHLAVVSPLQSDYSGELEAALCRKWNISAVLCRESGGPTQRIWEAVCKDQNIDLWMLSRPKQSIEVESVSTVNDLINRIAY